MKRMTLGEACLAIVDCEHKTAPIDDTGDFFAVGTPAMRGNVIDYSESRRINAATFLAWTRRMEPQLGDLLFAREAPVGPIVKIPKRANVAPGQRTVLLRPNSTIVDSSYLYYLLASPREQSSLIALAAGSTVSHLNVADVRAYVLPVLPPLPDQRAIAEVLEALDDKISANATTIDIGEDLASTLYCRLTLEADEAVPLGEVMRLEYGKSLPASKRESGSVPVYGSGGVVGSHAMALVQGPGVVVGRKGTAGAVHWSGGAFYPIDTTFFVVPQDNMPMSFCYFALKSARLSDMNSDSAVPGLNRNEANAAMVRLPSSSELKTFDEQVTALFRLAAGLARENVQIARTRDALLPALMSGKIRVKDAERAVEGAV